MRTTILLLFFSGAVTAQNTVVDPYHYSYYDELEVEKYIDSIKTKPVNVFFLLTTEQDSIEVGYIIDLTTAPLKIIKITDDSISSIATCANVFTTPKNILASAVTLNESNIQIIPPLGAWKDTKYLIHYGKQSYTIAVGRDSGFALVKSKEDARKKLIAQFETLVKCVPAWQMVKPYNRYVYDE